MKITFYSLLMSLLWSSLMIFITHFFRKKPFFLHKIGVPFLLGFYLLSIVRMVFPVEFPFVQEISLRNWYSQVMESFYQMCIRDRVWAAPLGGKQVLPAGVSPPARTSTGFRKAVFLVGGSLPPGSPLPG